MGMCNVPAHFQWVMEDVLKRGPDDPPLTVAIFLDDVTVPADNLEQVVMVVADTIKRVCRAGAMVRLYKGMIGATET